MSTDNLGPVGGPKSFDYGIEFDSPFTFDPTAGNLLMDLTVVDATGPLLLDFSFAPTETTSFHWTGTLGHESPVAATTPEAVGGPFGGHAIQFTMVPEPHANRSPFFWDEFDRSDLFDSDISYIRDDTPEEEYEIVDGSLIVNSLADDYPAVRVDVPDGMDDFIIKTQGRILNNENCQWAWLGMYGRAVESGTSDTFDSQNGNYWAGYSTQGQIHIGETSAEPATTIHTQKQEYSCREATENDVHMEFRILGSELEFTTWLDGSPRPEEPNLTWTDNTWTENDFAGVFINPDHLEDFALRYLAILPAIDGDFDASGVLDATDLDLLSAEVRSGGDNRALDLNGDAIVNDADRLALIHDLLDTWSGDSNLDGEFNSSDLVEVFQAGQYEDAIVGNSTWATGDWNGDAEFDSADFVVAFQEGGFEMGPRVANHVVPEPTFGLLGLGLMLLASSSRVVRNRR
ncbi:MAG: hypothetical protein KDA87_09690 [Planctomycetales bacterium]|nr:hypothetical protein [Planctomycetales bacterium]